MLQDFKLLLCLDPDALDLDDEIFDVFVCIFIRLVFIDQVLGESAAKRVSNRLLGIDHRVRAFRRSLLLARTLWLMMRHPFWTKLAFLNLKWNVLDIFKCPLVPRDLWHSSWGASFHASG